MQGMREKGHGRYQACNRTALACQQGFLCTPKKKKRKETEGMNIISDKIKKKSSLADAIFHE